GTSKPSAAAVSAAAPPAQRGIVVCPGAALNAVASRLTFQGSLAAGAAASFVLGCARDCLYLATLDGPSGQPLVARRGAMRGGAAPLTVGLPKTALDPSATYR